MGTFLLLLIMSLTCVQNRLSLQSVQNYRWLRFEGKSKQKYLFNELILTMHYLTFYPQYQDPLR